MQPFVQICQQLLSRYYSCYGKPKHVQIESSSFKKIRVKFMLPMHGIILQR